jgi:hypothetical protein
MQNCQVFPAVAITSLYTLHAPKYVNSLAKPWFLGVYFIYFILGGRDYPPVN